MSTDRLDQLTMRLRQVRELRINRFEMAALVDEWSRLYLEANPSTARGAAGALTRSLRRHKVPSATVCQAPSWAAVLAERTGLSERQLRRSAQSYRDVSPAAREVITGWKRAPREFHLLQLARMTADEQLALVRSVPGPGMLAKALRAREVAAHAAGEPVSEMRFMRELMLAVGRMKGVRVWRQNVGTVPVRDRSGEIVRLFDAGPPKGAADLTGILEPYGTRLEIECKADGGELGDEQEKWRAMIERMGGFYVFARYSADASLEENVSLVVHEIENFQRQLRSA